MVLLNKYSYPVTCLCFEQASEVGAMAMGGLSKLANLSITLQRRWSNVLTDTQRQQIVEMFLGLRCQTFFPSAQLLYRYDLPREEVSAQPIMHGNMTSLTGVVFTVCLRWCLRCA